MKNEIDRIVLKYLEKYPDEKENLSRLLELIQTKNTNLFSRKNFVGHITASGFVYCIEDRKLLLLEHKALNKFLQPGGHIEEVDNKILDGAKREVLEETGLKDLEMISVTDDIDVPFDINSHFIPANDKKGEDGHYHHDFGYLFIVNNIEDVKLDFNESNGYKWVSIDDLKNDKIFSIVVNKIESLTSNYQRKL